MLPYEKELESNSNTKSEASRAARVETFNLPAADANLDEILCRDVRDVGRVEVGGGVHPLVQVLLLDVGVTVDVDDTDVLGGH